SDYSFTSEVGEFNDRFEIVFTNPSLSIDLFTSNEINTTVISLPNDQVKFIAPKSLNIKAVTIYDNLGSKIINLKGSKNTETYNLNILSQSVYLAEIELSNNQKVIKKFIKK
ncbi:MAG: T9SS type A sorting domain-containing protein, partial [Flavobacteriaceae bacterium]|nr:T9SS type A sorting domain-containing protein [Flavobacteriaceae bacterium]